MLSFERTIKGKHVVVIGGAGFIGSHLVDLLATEGAGRLTIVDNLFLGSPANLLEARHKMTGLQLLYIDASDNRSMREMFANLESVDVVFDLAEIPLLASLEQPQLCFETNVHITSVLCELLREGRFETLVHFSSSAVYGTADVLPINEERPLHPLTPYAASKAASATLVQAYIASYGLDALIVRPFNIYGPRQNDRQYAGVIPTLLQCALNRRPFTLFGDGEQTRDFCYISDLVRATLALYKCHAAHGRVVNIASGQEIRLLDLKTKIEQLLGSTIACQQHDPQPGDVRRQQADITLLQELTSFEPQISIDEGLRRTVDFYCKQTQFDAV